MVRRLGDLATIVDVTVSPQRMGAVEVDHFSIPYLDRTGGPERTRAEAIRSNKNRLDRPVVLLSRLNPHIPRSWIAEPGDRLALASTELIALAPKEGVGLGEVLAITKSMSFRTQLQMLVTGTSTSHQRVREADCLDINVPRVPASLALVLDPLMRALVERRHVELRLRTLAQRISRARFAAAVTATGSTTVVVSAIAEVVRGVSYASRDFGDFEQRLLTLKAFGSDGSLREAGLRPWGGSFRPAQLIRAGDATIAGTDLSQAATVIGRALYFPVDPRFPTAASLDNFVLRARGEIVPGLVFGAVDTEAFRAACRRRANGTTVLHLPAAAVQEISVAIPTGHEATRSVGEAIDRLQSRVAMANATLARLDALQASAAQLVDQGA